MSSRPRLLRRDAGLDPMQHYLQYGLYEGRSAFGDTTSGYGTQG